VGRQVIYLIPRSTTSSDGTKRLKFMPIVVSGYAVHKSGGCYRRWIVFCRITDRKIFSVS
jgi:hypothetical protein